MNIRRVGLASIMLLLCSTLVMASKIDGKWKEHLLGIDHLREGIHLRGYGQRDPLVEYQREAYEMFMAMIDSIREDSLEYIFRIQAVETEDTIGVFKGVSQQLIHSEAGSMRDMRKKAPLPEQMPIDMNQMPHPPQVPDAGPPKPYKRDAAKVGRNDPCICGSGKKYKKCCGK